MKTKTLWFAACLLVGVGGGLAHAQSAAKDDSCGVYCTSNQDCCEKGCKSFCPKNTVTLETDNGPQQVPFDTIQKAYMGSFAGGDVGAACSETSPCKAGLACDGGTCKRED